ncbi:hypothetical protein JQ634_25925 [Bradyrhizobium sp. AUGA SZCCT0240]|uniref:hypothetical protein n=1 Tax=unclassified Bradyrhizobium TaxID=2631580 RepID=UPI001BA756A9|nr:MULTISPECIES: hypothetical protein [unclassified Bradyrhizobium]MBR1257118.1 hypothetical protein [Bradyrhizobium sp. AUGA SZCCT0240]
MYFEVGSLFRPRSRSTRLSVQGNLLGELDSKSKSGGANEIWWSTAALHHFIEGFCGCGYLHETALLFERPRHYRTII